jgi:hypothetical protein
VCRVVLCVSCHEWTESLRDKTWVEFIEPNVVMRSTATQTLSSSSSIYPWGLDRIDQRHLPLNERYEYVTPTSGVRVYVIDTGILTTHIGTPATPRYTNIPFIPHIIFILLFKFKLFIFADVFLFFIL